MHAVGRLFPRGDRAPAIEPVAEDDAAAADRRRTRSRALRRRSATRAHRERLLHLAGAGACARDEAPQRRISRGAGQRLGPRFLPFADAATAELPLGRLLRLSLFQVSVGMAHGAAERHAQPGDDRRARRSGLARRADGVAAARVRAVPRAGRLPLRHAPLGARLAARAVHLDRHAAAVRRARDHALRAARAVGRHARPGRGSDRSAQRSRSCWSARVCTRRRPPVSRSPPIWRRPRRGRAWWRCSTSCCCSAWSASALLFGALLADFSQVRLIQVIQGAALATMVLNLRRAVEAGGARPLAHCPRQRAARVPRIVARVHRGRSIEPPAGRGRTRHRRLQHAGHPARALRRPDPAPHGRGDDGAHGAARRRRARWRSRWPRDCSTAAAIPIAWPRCGALVGIARVRRGDLRRRRSNRALLFRVGDDPDRLRRRPVLRRHADRRDGTATATARAASRSARGAPCRQRRPASPSPSAARSATRCPGSPRRGCSGPALTGPCRRLQRRLPHRDRVAVRDAGRDRSARAHVSASRRQPSSSKFGLAEFPG